MCKFQIIILSTCILFTFATQGQSVIKEFSLPDKKVENIQSFTSVDNIYLFYDGDNKSDLSHRAYQIAADGSSKELVLEYMEKTLLVGVRDEGASVWFYYLTGKKRDLSLRALIYDKNTGNSKWLITEIDIPGQVLGISNDGFLSIVIYDKEFNQLRLMEIDWFKVVYDKPFDLPINLSSDYKYVAYIEDDPWASIEQGAAKFKLYKTNKKLILSVDYTFYESSYTSPQTKLIIFDLESGSQSVKSLETKIKSTFRSFVCHDILYRSFASKKIFQLEMLNISTGELIHKEEIVRDTTLKETFVYTRNGKTFRTSKNDNLYKMMSDVGVWEPSIIAVSENDSCTNTIIWGSYYPDENGPVIVVSLNPFVAALSMVAGNAIMQMKTPTTLSRYFYRNGNCPQEFTTNKSHRQIIDEYETSLDKERIFFKYKNYFSFQKRPVGLYYSERTHTIKLVKF